MCAHGAGRDVGALVYAREATRAAVHHLDGVLCALQERQQGGHSVHLHHGDRHYHRVQRRHLILSAGLVARISVVPLPGPLPDFCEEIRRTERAEHMGRPLLPLDTVNTTLCHRGDHSERVEDCDGIQAVVAADFPDRIYRLPVGRVHFELRALPLHREDVTDVDGSLRPRQSHGPDRHWNVHVWWGRYQAVLHAGNCSQHHGRLWLRLLKVQVDV
mmetsp:Transcript_10401/g.31791  ORF Transcript_10401/g.31791 Transcript_10401/m.31791 type:complete len:216 (-) Transcript_10401:1896-2543(-)